MHMYDDLISWVYWNRGRYKERHNLSWGAFTWFDKVVYNSLSSALKIIDSNLALLVKVEDIVCTLI